MSSIDAFLTPGLNSETSHTPPFPDGSLRGSPDRSVPLLADGSLRGSPDRSVPLLADGSLRGSPDRSPMHGDSSFNKRINSQALVYKDQPMSQTQIEKLVVGATPLDIRAQLIAVLSDPKNPIYYDGFVFRGVNGLTIAEAFDKVCKIATEVILIKAPRMPYKTAQFIAQEFVKLFPDFAMKDLPNNINYGSKEWAKMHIGFSYGKKEGQSVDGLSTAQLLTLGDAALKADANWGEKLLLLMAAAMGQLNLGALDTIPPPELKKILARIATEAFADDLAKAALLSKLIEDQKILSSLQKNIPTLPSPYTETDYEAYNHAFSTYRDRSAGMVKMIFEDQTALLPVWAQTEIRGGRARTVPLQMGVSYKQNDVTRVSQKYRYEQPGIFPFFLQIMHEGKERFVLYTLGAIAPELVPEGMGLQEFMTKIDMDAFFPKEWVAQRLQEVMINEIRSNAFNHREMPEGKNIDILSFFEPSSWRARNSQDIGLNLQNRFRSLIQETHKKTYYQDRNDQFAAFLQPVAALVPGAGELSAFAQGDVKGALVNLLGDLLLIFGVGAVSKALESGALASLVGKSADFVEKLVSDTVEKIRPSKPNPASPELIPLIDMGTERTNIERLWGGEGGSAQVGQKPSPLPSSSDSIPLIDMGTEETSLESLWGSEGGITGTFADANNQTSTAIFRLKPGEKASDPDALYGILDDNTKKISPQNYLKNPNSNHFVQTGLKGGAPGGKLALTVKESLSYRQPTPDWSNLEWVGPKSASLYQDKINGRFYYHDVSNKAYYEIFQNNGSRVFRTADSKNWYIPHPNNAAPRIWLELKDGGFFRTNPHGAERLMRLTPEEIVTYQEHFPSGNVDPIAFHPEGFAENIKFSEIRDGRVFYIDGDGNVFEMVATEDRSVWWMRKDGAPPLRIIADANGHPSVLRNISPSSNLDRGSAVGVGQGGLSVPGVQSIRPSTKGGAPINQGAPVPFDVNDPRLTPYRASNREIAGIQLLGAHDIVDNRMVYNNTTHDSGYIMLDDAHVYRWRDIVSTGPLGERIVERHLVRQDQQAGSLIVQNQATGLWSIQQRPSPQPGPADPQTLPSTVSTRPLSPDGVQPLPPKKQRGAGGISVADMPQELTSGSEGFWYNKRPAVRQLARDLFQGGKIYDITYGNGGKGINGKFSYFGNEYRFSFSAGRDSAVLFQDTDGNVATPPGIVGQKFAEFLHVIEGAPEPLVEGAPAPAVPRPRMVMQNVPASFSIPSEFNPPGAENFWARIDRSIQFLLMGLHRSREIYGINFSRSSGGSPRLNAVMRYQGRDYAFYIGTDRRLTFSPGVTPPPGFRNTQGVREALQKLAGSTLPRGTGPTYS